LYYSIFTNAENRSKVALAVKGEGDTSAKGSPINDLFHKLGAQKNGEGFYKSSVLKNKDGTDKLIPCFDNLPKTILDKENRKKELEIDVTVLLEDDLKKKSKDRIENQQAIKDKEKELQKKDKEISKLAKDEVPNLQTKLNDLGVADASFEFTSDKNIIKACAAKQLLLNIRWLENDGDVNGSFKLNSNQVLFDKISSAQTDEWNAAVKRYFEGKGSDLQARIKKVEEEESTENIGLEVIRDAYEAMGETTVVEAINEELKPETPTTDITKESLTRLFGFTVDDILKGKWSKSDDKALTKNDVETIVINDYSPTATDKTKYNGLMAYLKSDGDDEGKTDDYDVSSDTKKKES